MKNKQITSFKLGNVQLITLEESILINGGDSPAYWLGYLIGRAWKAWVDGSDNMGGSWIG